MIAFSEILSFTLWGIWVLMTISLVLFTSVCLSHLSKFYWMGRRVMLSILRGVLGKDILYPVTFLYYVWKDFLSWFNWRWMTLFGGLSSLQVMVMFSLISSLQTISCCFSKLFFQQMEVIQDCLEEFSNASGTRVSYDKTSSILESPMI